MITKADLEIVMSARREALRENEDLRFKLNELAATISPLILAASKVRLLVKRHAPKITEFPDWNELTEAMRKAEEKK